MDALLSALFTAIVSSSVASLVIGSLLAKRTETVKQQVLAEFQRLQESLRSQRTWQERSVAELLAPVVMQLGRTKRAFGRWKAKNVYLESKVIRDGNLAIRDALLGKPHLIPTALVEHAHRLVEHYDRWLEEFGLPFSARSRGAVRVDVQEDVDRAVRVKRRDGVLRFRHARAYVSRSTSRRRAPVFLVVDGRDGRGFSPPPRER